MCKRVFSFILIFLSLTTYSQNSFPEGVYLTAEQLRSRKPAFQANFLITPNEYLFSKELIDYSLIPTDTLNRGYIRRNVYAYVKNDSTFINCGNFELPQGFAYVETPGNFMVFKTNKPVKTSMTEGEREMVYCIVSLRTGNMRLLQPAYVEARLKRHTDLLRSYSKESRKESPRTMIKYISILNDKVPLSSSSATASEED